MKKLFEILSYVAIGAVVLWAGGTWYHILLAQLFAAAVNLIGYTQALEKRP